MEGGRGVAYGLSDKFPYCLPLLTAPSLSLLFIQGSENSVIELQGKIVCVCVCHYLATLYMCIHVTMNTSMQGKRGGVAPLMG